MVKTKEDIDQINNKDNAVNLGIKIEDYKYILDSINSWIISADNKVSIYCGMYSVVIAVITVVANRIISATGNRAAEVNQTAQIWLVVTIIIAIASFLASVVFYSWSVKPDLIGRKACVNDVKKLSLFYHDISKFNTSEEFVNVVKNTDREKYLEELLTEVYYNSIVCTAKMERFQIAITLSTVSVFTTVLSCIEYYYSYY